MRTIDASAALMKLGFTETEARTYCELLRQPGATGYAVAKALQKSQANIYSALSALEAKGAVLFDKGAVKAYRAVPPDELFSRLRRDLGNAFELAEGALADLAGPEKTDRIYQLANSEQVYERAAIMCGRASDSISFALFPGPFQRLRLALAEATGRAVGVAGVTFDPADSVAGALCVPSIKLGRTARWPGDQLTLVVDAREAMVALFDSRSNKVIHAVYTDSVYLSCLLHAATVDAIILNQLNPEALRTSFNKKLFGKVPAGFLDLLGEA